MGFKAVISKKSINKSKMIAERFSNWLKEKEKSNKKAQEELAEHVK